MEVNISITDRIIRALITLMLLAAISSQLITGIGAIIVGVITFIFCFTSMSGNCPLYTLIGVNTASGN